MLKLIDSLGILFCERLYFFQLTNQSAVVAVRELKKIEILEKNRFFTTVKEYPVFSTSYRFQTMLCDNINKFSSDIPPRKQIHSKASEFYEMHFLCLK